MREHGITEEEIADCIAKADPDCAFDQGTNKLFQQLAERYC
jgi:hypothetical protein